MWHIPLIPVSTSQKQKQADVCEFKASLVYIGNISRIARAKQRNTASGTREMAQWLRAPTALPEVLGSTPSNHMVVHNYVMRSDALF